MKVLAAVAAVMMFASVAVAGGKNKSGADEFRKTVVQCLVAGMAAGAADPVALAEGCVEATQVVWAASYPFSP